MAAQISPESPPPRLPQGSPPSRLPRGAAALPPEVVLADQRKRLLEAVAHVIGTKGYAAATITDIVGRARVSRSAFYDCFADKEEAFLAAYSAEAERHFAQVSAATAEMDWVEQLRAGVAAYVRELEARPVFARTFLIQILAAGPRALAHREAVYSGYAELMKSWYEQAPPERRLPALPDEVFRGAVGAINELAVARLQSPDPDRQLPLERVVLYGVLSLFGLSAEARQALEAAPVPAPLS